MKPGKQPKRPRLLADHKQFGKKLVPPLMQLGNLQLTSWVDVGIPESIWIAALHDHLGLAGVKVGLEICKAVDVAAQSFVAMTSEFAGVSSGQILHARDTLSVEDRDQLGNALRNVVGLYPESPLSPLVPGPVGEIKPDVTRFKILLEQMFDRTSRIATLAQASLVYFMMVQGRLQVYKASALSQIADIESYPDTPESQRVASSVRGALNMYFQRQSAITMVWPRYFWNRGFEIEPCYFTSGVTGDAE